MEMAFCRRCGSPLEPQRDNAFACAQGHTLFLNPSPAVGVFFITPDNHVILSRRGIEPNKGMLDAFGGFIEPSESLEEGLARELREELSLEPHEYEPPQYFISAISQYHELDGDIVPLIGAFFWSRLLTDRPLEAADDVAEVVTLPLAAVDHASLSGPDIETAIVTLQKLFLGETS